MSYLFLSCTKSLFNTLVQPTSLTSTSSTFSAVNVLLLKITKVGDSASGTVPFKCAPCATGAQTGNTSADLLIMAVAQKQDPEEPKTRTVPLTAALLGAAMLGQGYKDPDPKFDNDRVNTGDTTGVKEIYEHDPSGIGDELADMMDDKLKNAKPTDDGKPSYIGDPKYDDRSLIDDRDDSSDRSWDEKGDEATGGTEPTKDPQTGEATGGQSITIQFPLFCSWASKMCQWYDDWKASDKIHQKFEEDVKNHQKDEKSFWQTIKDWFTWTKENDDLPENEKPQITEISTPELKEDAIRWSAQCPADAQVPINMQGVSSTITFSWSPWCQLLDMIKPAIIASAYIGAAFIVLGLRT